MKILTQRHRGAEKKNPRLLRSSAFYSCPIVCLALVCLLAACGQKEGAAPSLPEGYMVGPTDQCHATPQFLSTLNFERPVIDTTQEFAVGVLVRDLAGESGQYQHDTWDDAGKVGPFAIDWLGNIFVAPAPVISLELNPVAEQNKIFKVDTRTGEMTEFASLPWPLPPGSGNPFGVVGLAYDCDTGSLYAASVAGSTPQDEVGVIYQINPDNGEILSRLENVDALGVGIFRASQGRRLYYGAGRTPAVYSVGLDGDGRFTGQPRLEFSLAAQPGGSTDKAQRIQFTTDNTMIVKAIEFNYSLQPTSRIQKDVYTFQYQPADDTWVLQSITQE